MQSNYKLRYLPVFYEDLNSSVLYIARKLKNPAAANKLVDSVEKAILQRLPDAESFEPYHSLKDRAYPYYRIYVDNYIIFYVVIDEGTDGRYMEVRRLLHVRQNRDSII
ncbi:MAG: type II toxin-antitoxin system RelE/ParE family toxin [Firmicutes bacterium]|nr:type II toxin-antitoxin system RelE/ParE family toxin [Bacillota bacterium]